MGKVGSKAKHVRDWVARIELLEQASESASGVNSNGLLVHQQWISKETPGIQQLEVDPLLLSVGKRHGKRKLHARRRRVARRAKRAQPSTTRCRRRRERERALQRGVLIGIGSARRESCAAWISPVQRRSTSRPLACQSSYSRAPSGSRRTRRALWRAALTLVLCSAWTNERRL